MGWHGGSARVAGDVEPATAARSGRRQASETLTDSGPVTAPEVLLRLQRTRGNQYVQRFLQPAAPACVVQPRLLLGPPGDRHEREADRLAENLAQDVAGGLGELDGALADGERGLPGPRISQAGTTAGGVLDPAVHQLLVDTGAAGRPLSARVRGGYERALRADFAGVRVHTGRRADEINFRLRSSAVTVGHDIFFRGGEYDPASDAGRELLTHELVHVVQQGAGILSNTEGAGALVQPSRGRPRKKRRRTAYSVESSGSESEPEPEDDDSDYVDPAPTVRKRNRSPEPVDIRPTKKAKKKKRSASQGAGNTKPTKPKKSATAAQPVSEEKAGKKKAGDKKADPTEIPVVYMGLEKMKEYLVGQKLTTDKDPAAISVGAVVWNINHLKADESDVESDDDDVIEVDDAEGTAVRQKKEYDVKAILAAMQTLKKRLGDVAKPLTAAADAATAHLEGQDTSKHVSAARREVSQVKTDIAQLSGNDLDKVLTPGIAAMTQEGTADIEARADQLEQVRAVARVWKRLVRLRTVLTGSPRIAEKKTAFATIRDALGNKVRRQIGRAIDGLLAELPINDVGLAVNALKRGAVVDLATGTFFKNPAVNLVLINEMNLGIGQLAAATGKTASRLGLSQGPVMLAKGRKTKKGAKGKAAITVGVGADKQQVTGRQYEFYPAMHRTGGEHGLTSRGTFYVSTAGEFAVQGKDRTNSAISWNKAGKTYRGIVVHRYAQAGQEFWAGILHTTPAGKDLERTKIWPQISTPLARLNELALHFRVPLLIGGDFYIPSEGIVKKPTAT